MKLFSFVVTIFFAIYLSYGIIVSQITLDSFDKTHTQKSRFYDYKGAINIHSIAGSGQGTIPEIIKAAYEAKLDFVIFTESSKYSSSISKNRYEENLLILNGREYSYLKSRLILLDPSFNYSSIKNAADAHLFLSDYIESQKDGFVLLNHPTKKGYEWSGDLSPGIDAIEIINLRDNWKQAWESSRSNFLISLLFYPFNANYAFASLHQFPEKSLKLWTSMSSQRKLIGLLGSDAKSKLKIFKDTYIRFPGYKKLFQIGTNHLNLRSELVGESKADTKKVFNALSNGNFYFSLDLLGSPYGFAFFAKRKNRLFLTGAILPSQETQLCIDLPISKKNITLTIFRNGQKLKTFKKSECLNSPESGLYNAIAFKKISRPWPFTTMNMPWIYSNFIKLE